MRSQQEISKSMRDQARIMNPELSLNPGTLERQIIDVVANEIASVGVDSYVKNYQYDIDTKFGTDLDDALSVFGFARQAAVRASGRVVFTRAQPDASPAYIPAGTQVSKPATSVTPQIIFQTVTDSIIPNGATFVEVPVEAIVAGESGNVPANTITSVGLNEANLAGISSVYNPVGTGGGREAESDAELSLRFKNTSLRNIAGTKHSLLAIAIAAGVTTKATYIGATSQFSEYLQIQNDGTATSGNPHAKYIYPDNYFLTTDGTETGDIFTPEIDYFFDDSGASPVIRSASSMFASPTVAPTVVMGNTNISPGLLGTYSWAYTYVYEYTNTASETVYGESAISPPTEFTLAASGDVVLTVPVGSDPDIVERRIYRLEDGLWYQVGFIPDNSITAYTDAQLNLGGHPPKPDLTPSSIVYLDHSYLSKNSRNVINPVTNTYILNRADIYINGESVTNARDVIPAPDINPSSPGNTLFNSSPGSPFNVANFVRDSTGLPPVVGNSFIKMIYTPVISLPGFITIGETSYALNTDYWLVKDITTYRGSKRSRDGIEFSSAMADAIQDSRIVINYGFNKVPLVINQVIDEHKQAGQDILIHTADFRYFITNLVVMYQRGANPGETNSALENALSSFFSTLDFGAVVQLSDILLVVRNIAGIDNARLATSTDAHDNYGVKEVDKHGNLVAFHTSDFSLGDTELAISSGIGPNGTPIQRSQNTWVGGL